MNDELILVVDDNAGLRGLVIEVLQASGFRTLAATDGREALRQIDEHKPDLMLLDLQMPHMDGMEVLQRLSKSQIELPVILMTAHGSEAIAVEVFRKGVKDYIIKGDKFEPETFLSVVQRSLSEVRLRREKEQLAERLLISNFKLQQRVDEFKILHSIGKSVASLMDMDTLLLRVLGAAAMLTQSIEGAIYLMERKTPVCRVIKRNEDYRPILAEANVSDPLVAQVAASRQAALVTPENGGQMGQCVIVTPLMAGEKLLGVMTVRNNGSNLRTFGKREMTLMSALADYTAIALENARNAKRYPPAIKTEPSMLEILKQNTVFISYSRHDWDQYVKPLVDFLAQEGFNVWLDQNLLLGGEDWLDKINEALASCTYMVLCVSPRSLGSMYVKFEYRYFIHHHKPLIPVICEQTVLPAELLNLHNLPYNALDTLAKLLKEMMSKGTSS
ncbi:MAG: response regulator [Anaerolineae bacterium]|nr:response regulator [Anaerolineae bacterium]